MRTVDEYKAKQKALAAAWKMRTPTLPDEARVKAPWINQDGQPRGRYDHCLAPEHSELNLLPEVRAGALSLFTELGIPWHAGVAGGPGNNLLSSQVQCVNALFPMVNDSARLITVFGAVLDIAEVLEIEPGRYLTFEYIGPHNYFAEGVGGERVRGSMCTSVDAAFKYRTSSGDIELALVEWKYTESYLSARDPEPAKDRVRVARYEETLLDPEGPIQPRVLPVELLLDEPFYQLMRQQLLARRLEKDEVEGATTTRVLHVLAPANAAYQESLVRPETQALGSTVEEVWTKLLRTQDRFLHLDPAAFLDEQITGADYIDRYAQSSSA